MINFYYFTAAFHNSPLCLRNELFVFRVLFLGVLVQFWPFLKMWNLSAFSRNHQLWSQINISEAECAEQSVMVENWRSVRVRCYKWLIFAIWRCGDNNTNCLTYFAECFPWIHLLSETTWWVLLTGSVNRQRQHVECSERANFGIKWSLTGFRIFKEILLPLYCSIMERFQPWILSWLMFSEMGFRFMRWVGLHQHRPWMLCRFYFHLMQCFNLTKTKERGQ